MNQLSKLNSTTKQQRGDIQGLRALAVLLVILGHASVPGFDGGYIGVDVFFVISGFLITGGIVREVKRTQTVSILDFYARRARRILPAASVTLLLIAICYSALMTAARTTKVFDDIGWSALFAVNIKFSQTGIDYFAEDHFVSPVQHFWSLAVEEQFYLFWPILVLLLCLPKQSITATEDRGQVLVRRIGITIVIAIITSFAWSLWRTPLEPTSAYFSPLTRSWEIGLGAAIAVFTSNGAKIADRTAVVLSWLGICMIMLSAIAYSSTTQFPGFAATIPVIGAGLILIGGLSDKDLPSARLLLDNRPMRAIGDISFSLYLWHWPLLIIPSAYLGRPLDSIERFVLVAVSFCFAVISYKFIEVPIRDTHKIVRNKRASLILWPVSVAAIFLCIGLLGKSTTITSNSQLTATIDDTESTDQIDDRQIQNAVSRAVARSLAADALPAELWPNLENLFEDISRPPSGCGAQRDEITHEICLLGDPQASKTIVLFGDSHIGMWYDALLPAILERDWKLVTFWKASCFPATVTLWRQDKLRPYTECDEFRTWAIEEMRRLQPDKIVLSGLIRNLPVNAEKNKPTTYSEGTKLMQAGLKTMLTTLQTISDDVIVFSGTPYLKQNPLDCLATKRADTSTCVISPDPVTVSRNQAFKLTTEESQANYIDLMPWFCKGEICPLVIGNVIVYRDTNHVSKTYTKILGDELSRQIGL